MDSVIHLSNNWAQESSLLFRRLLRVVFYSRVKTTEAIVWNSWSDTCWFRKPLSKMHDQHPGFWLPLFWEPGHQKYLERAIKSIINNCTRLSMKMKKIMQIEEGFTPPRSVEPIHTKSNPTIIFLSIQNIQSNLKHAFLVLCKAPVFKVFTFSSAISRY